MAERAVGDFDKFVVRLPPGLRDRIRHEAEVNNRSMNSEIVERIEQSLHDEDALRQLSESNEVANQLSGMIFNVVRDMKIIREIIARQEHELEVFFKIDDQIAEARRHRSSENDSAD